MSFNQLPELLNPVYWLNAKALTVSGTLGTVIFIIFIVTFALGVIARVISRKQFDKYVRLAYVRAASMFTTMGLLGGLLFLLSSERIQFFGGRFWYPLWLLTLVFWAVLIAKYIKRDAPLMRKRAHEHRNLRKYIPGQKKKSKR